MPDIKSSSDSSPLTFLCLASYEKGQQALSELKRLGCKVYLLTSLSLKDKADWPRESLDDILYLEDDDHVWNSDQMLRGVSYLARTIHFDRIMALDDFDVEKAALLREHFRLPGLGQTAARYFRDKLAMRVGAQAAGYKVPEFTATFSYSDISHFLDHVPAPWVLKPRLQAGAMGIKKFNHAQEVWDRIHGLGDEQPDFVLERFVGGDIFHVDSLWFAGEPLFSSASAYGTPPLELTTGGGIFTTRVLDSQSDTARRLCLMNEQVLSSFGLAEGASHTEFIRAHEDGELYFLETSARVGGAHIADLIEHAAGLNLWVEWARLEVAAARNETYTLLPVRTDYAGLLVSLARQEWPDTSSFNDPELVWRLNKKSHVGFIVKSDQKERVESLIAKYAERVRADYHASVPLTDA